MIKEYSGKHPKLSGAYVAENATLIGDVQLAPYVSVWYGVVLRGDEDRIVIGENTNIQDNSVAHCAHGIPTVVGKNCVVGHNVILHSCTVEDDCLIGMGAVLLNGCVIGRGSIVAAGSVVTEGKVIPPDSMVMGIPGRVVRTLADEDREMIAIGAQHYRTYAEAQLPKASF